MKHVVLRRAGAVAAVLFGLAIVPMAAEAEPCTQLPKGADTLDCTCAADVSGANVWGSGPYTADSDICGAAVHAGVISAASGGPVHVERVPGLDRYPGSSANGVKSGTWGPFSSAITVSAPMADLPRCGRMPEDADSLECLCPGPVARGSVWGTGPYTADSDICTAAVHAGAIGLDQGGAVRVKRVAGQASYDGGAAHGVNTNSWGSYASSIIVAASGAVPGAAGGLPAGVEACGRLPDGVDKLVCGCSADQTGVARSIWGSGPYTADSDICTAAVHAGVAAEGVAGVVTVLRAPGLDRYRGSEQNDVQSGDWGAYGSSIVFDRN